MRQILFGSLLILALVLVVSALAPDRGTHSMPANDPSIDLNGATSHLGRALWRLFGYYAEFDMSVQTALWNLTPPDLRPLLGMIKLAHLLITIWGLISLSMASRLLRRVL